MFKTPSGCFGGIVRSLSTGMGGYRCWGGSHLRLWIQMINSVISKRQNFFARKCSSVSVTQSEYLSGRWPRSKVRGFGEPQFGFTQPFWPSGRIIPTFFHFLSSKTHSSRSPQYIFLRARFLFFSASLSSARSSLCLGKSSSHRNYSGALFCKMRRIAWILHGMRGDRHSPHVPGQNTHTQAGEKSTWPEHTTLRDLRRPQRARAGGRAQSRVRAGGGRWGKNTIRARIHPLGWILECAVSLEAHQIKEVVMAAWCFIDHKPVLVLFFFSPELQMLWLKIFFFLALPHAGALTGGETMRPIWHIWQKKNNKTWKTEKCSLGAELAQHVSVMILDVFGVVFFFYLQLHFES